MIQRWNVSVVKDSDSPCDCRADLVAASDGDFVLHRESHEAIRSWMQNSENYAKLLDNALRERDEAKRCLHVEMSMRKDAEVEPPKSVGPWHVVPGHDGAFVPVTKDGRSWWNGYFQASIAIDVATLLNERESHSAEIAKLRAEAEAEKNHARQAQAESLDYATKLDESRMERGRLAEQLSAARAALDGERAACDEAKWFIEYLSATNDGQRADAEAWLFGYRARRAAEAQPTPVRCPECDGTGRRVKYHGGSINDPNLIGLAMESLPCRCQAAEARP